MILSAGSSADKHYASYHRVFSAACWSLDALGLALLDLIQPFCGKVVMLALDDTLARKRSELAVVMLGERCRHVSLDIYGRNERVRLADCAARMHAAPDLPLRVAECE